MFGETETSQERQIVEDFYVIPDSALERLDQFIWTSLLKSDPGTVLKRRSDPAVCTGA